MDLENGAKDSDDESLSPTSSSKLESSVNTLASRMKFARDTALLTIPTWQIQAQLKAKSVIAISDTITGVLSNSSDCLSIGVQNSDGEALTRISSMIYFSGVLIGNFRPESQTEGDETFFRIETALNSIENDTIHLLKRLKKLSLGVDSFTASIFPELSRSPYKFLTNLTNYEKEPENFDRLIFKKYPLDNFVGVWLELINCERDALTLQCQNVTNRRGQLIRLRADDLPLNPHLIKVTSLLLAEIQDSVKKAMDELNEIKMEGNTVKIWRETGSEFIRYLKYIRISLKFGEANCATSLKNSLNEMIWKLNYGITLKIRGVRNTCVWILKGVECIRRKSRIWMVDREIQTSPRVLKYISNPPSKISKFLPCFSAPKPNANLIIDFVRMFNDIGNAIGENFLLQVPISEPMKETLFGDHMDEDTDEEVIDVPEKQPEIEILEIIDLNEEIKAITYMESIDCENQDICGMASLASESYDHGVILEPTFNTESQVKMSQDMPNLEIPIMNNDPNLEDVISNGFSSMTSPVEAEVEMESQGKLNSFSNSSQQNIDFDLSSSPLATTSRNDFVPSNEKPSSHKKSFYWARHLMEKISKYK